MVSFVIVFHFKEKWDLMTRKWKNRHSIMNSIKLFLVDEIHVLGENSRGAVIEAVISRMKTLCNHGLTPGSTNQMNFNHQNVSKSLRFIAISATIPNIDDV